MILKTSHLRSARSQFRRVEPDLIAAITQLGSLTFGFRILLSTTHSQVHIHFRVNPHINLSLLVSSPSFLTPQPSTTYATSPCLLSIHTLKHYPQQRYSSNKHNLPHTHNRRQTIMSEAVDSTFSAGETKLLISIIKHLTGDLQVCFHFHTVILRASQFHVSLFCCRTQANVDISSWFSTYSFSRLRRVRISLFSFWSSHSFPSFTSFSSCLPFLCLTLPFTPRHPPFMSRSLLLLPVTLFPLSSEPN